MVESELTGKIISESIRIHKSLGPGLLESAYKECLFYSLTQKGIYVQKEKPMPLEFEYVRLDCGYRLDLLVENKIVVEIKSTDAIHDVHIAQVLTYLKLSKCRVGLLINFNVPRLKDGIKRLINGY
jgi:GxxExxY protein